VIEASPLTGLVEILAVIALCFLGVHIAISLGTVGMLSAWLYYGSAYTAFSLVGNTAWEHSNSYMLSMIPLFVLMGVVVAHSQLGADAYDGFYKWLTKLRGGLALVATFTSALFGCVTGSSVATIATIGGISNPEMKKHGYDVKLRLGSIACAGQLGMLIPPSIPAIIYCVLVEESVGKVFIGNIVPGILLTLFFAATIYVWTRLRPEIAPMVDVSFTWKEKFVALKGPVPIAIIFIFLIWGIYAGIFSPTEAGGIGTIACLAMGFILRRLNWHRIKDATRDVIRITAMILLIIMGAFVFTHSLALTGIHGYIGGLVAAIGGPPIVGMFVIILVFLITGCFMDVFAVQVLFIPLFYPTVLALGFDSVWFGTMTVILIEIALLTPPIAASLYIAQQLDPESTFGDVVRGVLPFYTAALGLVVLMVFFPQIVLWLPNQMIGG
jgi:tripartite ATP-independent transporter DctM subunit